MGGKLEEAQATAYLKSFEGWELVVEVKEAFEECLELSWRLEITDKGNVKSGPPSFRETILEMVLDHSNSTQPSKDAHVKRVPCGSDRQASLSMPMGRRFLIAATAEVAPGRRLRSGWVRAATLSAAERPDGWVAVDPMGRTRQDCKVCSCKGYVPFKWSANSRDAGRCRRCGCGCQSHALGGEAMGGGSASSLRDRAEEWKRKNEREQAEPLPPEAVWWSDRECDLWFRTGGLFHPQHARTASAASSRSVQQDAPNPLNAGVGKRRRISVLTPTTESRQRFHQTLWACFEAQTWPNKELVVVETYTSSPSRFLQEKAAEDSRLVYVGCKRPDGEDWSIGLKRNICAQLSMGDLLAHFDDDDLYAPEYLSRMAKELRENKAQVVKLASWFTFDYRGGNWIHCDPLASSAKRGADETEEWTRQWLYGYGFSYLYLRQAAMENPYPDVNLGEDYEFVKGIQQAKGRSSIALVQDESGICLHTQHSSNTSSSQHLVLRYLTREEVLDLEVADLQPVFNEYLQRLQMQEAVRIFVGEAESEMPVSHRRNRLLKVHAPDRDVDLRCTAGATADELRPLLEETLGSLPFNAKLFWAPPPGRAPEAQRQELLQHAVRLVAPCLALPSGEPSPEQRDAAERVERPLNPQDRVGSRTAELWLTLPTGIALSGRSSPYVRVTVQRPAKGSLWDTFSVELPPDATCIDLRRALMAGLPPSARILVQKRQEGLVDLPLHDPVPDRVVVSEFTTQLTGGLIVPRGMARELQRMMLDLLRARKVQDKISACLEQAQGNEKMLNIVVFSLVMEDVFPRMAEHVELQKAPFFRIFQGAMDVHGKGELDHTFNFLELELLMRNKSRILAAFNELQLLMEGLSAEARAEAEKRLERIQEAWPSVSWQEMREVYSRSRMEEQEAVAQVAAAEAAAAAAEERARLRRQREAEKAAAEAAAAEAAAADLHERLQRWQDADKAAAASAAAEAAREERERRRLQFEAERAAAAAAAAAEAAAAQAAAEERERLRRQEEERERLRQQQEVAGGGNDRGSEAGPPARLPSTEEVQQKPGKVKEAREFSDINGWELTLDVGGAFEECLDLAWKLERFGAARMFKQPEVKEYTLEMVLDRGGPLKPSPDAHIKRVACGKDRKASVNMPEGRRFLISAIAEVGSGSYLRSAWVRTATLRAADRSQGWRSIDPKGLPRHECKVCPCKEYVPFRWDVHARDSGRCRRCGCGSASHALGAGE